MIPMEIFSLIGGSLAGFLFKYLSVKAQNEKEKFDRMMQAIDKFDSSADLAAKRTQGDTMGQWVRRFLVVSLVFGIIVAPFILTLINLPTIVESESPKHSFLGLFDWGGKKEFFELNGYLITSELRSAVLAVVGYYMGNASAKRI